MPGAKHVSNPDAVPFWFIMCGGLAGHARDGGFEFNVARFARETKDKLLQTGWRAARGGSVKGEGKAEV